ncbi:MAG: ATP-binding protein [Hamadaea sp.]|uniref:NACHT domain-containing protein n=1 Tax=Hamadaea sp. TaxID=2024425 RepID=UPI0017E7A0B6|nr:hypothetical protein [Hamadaea sp.]NUT22504.1 ATP-binding protein [Hamadaea sp.]
MRYDSALSYAGALRILGHYEHKSIERLSKALGGLALTAGAALALSSGAAAVPAAVVLAAVWGWIDQKNEAMDLLRSVSRAVQGRIHGTRGPERHHLVIAAHTVLAVSAYFEVLQEELGDRNSALVALTAKDRLRLVGGRGAAGAFDALYEVAVPAPSAARGFAANLSELTNWYFFLTIRTQTFLDGLAGQVEVDTSVVDRAVARYRSRYLELAATVPEFRIWAMLTETAAINSRLDDVQDRLQGLVRVERLLTELAPAKAAYGPLAEAVHRLNQGVLREPIVPDHAERYHTAVAFPTVEDAFIDPRYRLIPPDADARPADETWWRQQPVRSNLDLLLTTYVTSADGAQAPMLLLGHPGAGKSLLTKVLAGRFPPQAYTIVRVSLRAVNANLRVHDQIQEALDLGTHGRVSWSRLSDEAAATIRVVLLDGLDELLQATTDNRSGYLHDVAEFQRREADLGHPVFVIVTSRTLVADRVNLPPGTVVVKLEDFDGDQIVAWLDRWRRANAPGITAGDVRDVAAADVLTQPELARQPLLLLMLTLYSADPTAIPLDADLSAARLYRRLFDNFIRRELSKTKGRARVEADDERIAEQLQRLALAAFAMFNRGRQNVSDLELASDTIGLRLADGQTERPEEIAFRIVGRFLFVHADQARTAPGVPAQRAYQFLHATFGEYLIAHRTMELVEDLVLTSGRGSKREPDDGELSTMLAHHPLATRGSILDFAADIFGEYPADQQDRTLRTLENLFLRVRQRSGTPLYPEYRPTPADQVRRLAAYTANLLMLRVALPSPATPFLDLANLWPADEAMTNWRSIVKLWEAGLDESGLTAILGLISRAGTQIRPVYYFRNVLAHDVDLRLARLIGDAQAETRLRYGHAVEGKVYYLPGDPWDESTISALIPDLVGTRLSVDVPELPTPTSDVPGDQLSTAVELVKRVLVTRVDDLSRHDVRDYVEWLGQARRYTAIDPVALALAVGIHPDLLDEVAWLWDLDLYYDDHLRLLLHAFALTDDHSRLAELASSLGGRKRLGLETARLIIQAIKALHDW